MRLSYEMHGQRWSAVSSRWVLEKPQPQERIELSSVKRFHRRIIQGDKSNILAGRSYLSSSNNSLFLSAVDAVYRGALSTRATIFLNPLQSLFILKPFIRMISGYVKLQCNAITITEPLLHNPTTKNYLTSSHKQNGSMPKALQ